MAATGFLGADRDQPALIVLEPISFQPDQLPKFLQDASLNLNLHNDAYSSFTAIGPASYQLQLTYPATSQHINKHIQQNYHRIIETAEVYKKVVKPYFDSIPADRTQWVRNIIQGISEQDRILYNDPDPQNGFILLPDIKWDGSNVQSLYIQAIARNPMIKSLRDLTTEHLPLLQRISTNGVTTIAKRYNVNPSLIRCYVHYHPSYYHFHVHLVHTALTTSSCVVGRAILLDDIIENIQLIGDYYQKRSIYYYLPENHDLYGMLKGTHECN